MIPSRHTRPLTLLLPALLAACSELAPAPAPAPLAVTPQATTVYSQVGTKPSGSICTYRNWMLADDFTVPAGESWMFNQLGLFGRSPTPSDTFTVYLYADNSNSFGKLLHTFKDRVSTVADGKSEVPLDKLTLTEGTYWVAFQTVGNLCWDRGTDRRIGYDFMVDQGSGIKRSFAYLYFALETAATPDVTQPTISLTTPADKAVYQQGEAVKADYTCTDEEGGSGVKGCVGTLASGATLDTSTPGSYSFTVDAEDNARNKTSVAYSYTVAKAAPALLFTGTPTTGERGSSVEVAVTSSSDAAVTLMAAPETVCTLKDKTLSLVAIGDCTVTASQPETANFTAGSGSHVVKVVRTLTPTKVSAVSGSSVYGGTATLVATLTNTDGAVLVGKTVSFEVVALPMSEVGSALTDESGVATLNGVDLQGLSAGKHPVIASFAGDDTDSLDASHSLGELTVAQAAQSVSFSTTPPSPATVGGSYTIGASATSSLPVTLVSDTPSVCTLSGNTVSFVGAGSCTLTASQVGDANYAAASVSQSFTVAVPTPVAVADTYLIDFESAPANRLIYSVKLRSGVVHQSGTTPKSATVPVVAKRRLNGAILESHLGKVVSSYGSKRLVVASPNSNTPAPTGGRVKLSFTNFDPNGVTLTSLTLSNLTTTQAYLTFYYANGSSSRQMLSRTAVGASVTVPLTVPGLRAVDIYSPVAFAVDNVSFTDVP